MSPNNSLAALADCRSCLKGAPVEIVLLLLILQLMAAIWYTASYIPYGRAMIRNAVCPCLRDVEGQT